MIDKPWSVVPAEQIAIGDEVREHRAWSTVIATHAGPSVLTGPQVAIHTTSDRDPLVFKPGTLVMVRTLADQAAMRPAGAGWSWRRRAGVAL